MILRIDGCVSSLLPPDALAQYISACRIRRSKLVSQSFLFLARLVTNVVVFDVTDLIEIGNG
jgi:hypothetical protein